MQGDVVQFVGDTAPGSASLHLRQPFLDGPLDRLGESRW